MVEPYSRTAAAPRVAIVGGSIAGCAAAIAARRAGCEVVVYERSPGDLAERGFGLTLSPDVHAELTAAGYLRRDSPVLTMARRLWVTRIDGGEWRELWCQPLRLVTAGWGRLWRSLRAEVADPVYRGARCVAAVDRAGGDRAVVRTDDGASGVYDLVVGADGYRSMVRAHVAADSAPRAAGYAVLRGVVPLGRIGDDPDLAGLLADTGLTAMFDGGHAIVYLIPGRDGPLINWALYARPPRGVPYDPRRAAFAPGELRHELLTWIAGLAEARLPDRIARIVARTPGTAIGAQPVTDRIVPSLGRAPFVLVGDAGTVARPHTASGAVKALQDAMCLERALRTGRSIGAAIAAYGADRTPAGNGLVELGRRIGRDQVEAAPDWSAMGPGAMRAHVAATWSGDRHYLHPGAG